MYAIQAVTGHMTRCKQWPLQICMPITPASHDYLLTPRIGELDILLPFLPSLPIAWTCARDLPGVLSDISIWKGEGNQGRMTANGELLLQTFSV